MVVLTFTYFVIFFSLIYVSRCTGLHIKNRRRNRNVYIRRRLRCCGKHTAEKLYDWVMRMNSFPAFWGRMLSGENRISEDEIGFLREKNCKVALIFNDLTELGVSGIDGTGDALRAVEAVKDLGVPQNEGIAVFADIRDDWSVNHNWMISFAHTLSENGYVPGFIGNTDSSANFNFDRQCSHFVQATEGAGQYGAVYWATEPKAGGEPENWTPFCPSALNPEDIGLWRCGQIGLGDIQANATYARDASLLDYMWNPEITERIEENNDENAI